MSLKPREQSGCEVWCQDLFALDLPDARFDGGFANAMQFQVPGQKLPRVLRAQRAIFVLDGPR